MDETRSGSCQHTLEQFWEFIDQECDTETSERLQAHLKACQSCFPQYDFQRAYRVFIAQRCRREAPAELRKKIFLALLEEERRGS
jgi:anti-sigma factor (TIGR02949 family)